MRFFLRLPCFYMPFIRLMALSILITASGCLAVPVPPAPDPFTDRKLDFIETGKTTKDEVRLTLSEPPFQLEPAEVHGGKLWLYSTVRAGWGSAGCIYYGPCWSDRGNKNHLLLFRFDEQGVVDYWWEGEGPYISAFAAVVVTEFDLELQKDGSKFLTHDGLTVEASKVTGIDEVRFNGDQEMLLVVKQDPDESWRKIYFGDVKPARDAASEPPPIGSHYLIDASTLRGLNAGLP